MADGKKNPLGPTGERVQTNVAQLRDARGLTYRELSERLEALGRPIPVLGLSRIERGERRVDADDLVALALALGVTPNRLLLPENDLPSTELTALTPAVTPAPSQAWDWANGLTPLRDEASEVLNEQGHLDAGWFLLVTDFRQRALPISQRQRASHSAFRAASDVLDAIARLLDYKRSIEWMDRQPIEGDAIERIQEEERRELRRSFGGHATARDLRVAFKRLTAEVEALVGDDDGER